MFHVKQIVFSEKGMQQFSLVAVRTALEDMA